jgi:hypothetical protein
MEIAANAELAGATPTTAPANNWSVVLSVRITL